MISAYDLEAIAFYFYNRSPMAVLIDVYGIDQNPDYVHEKLALLMRGYHVLWAGLDVEHKHRLAAAIMRFCTSKHFDATAFEGEEITG